MQFQKAISCTALAALMVGLFANSAAAQFASGPARRSEAAAFASSAKGDNWMATNLFEQARAANDSAANRFNLAVAYEITGRASDAASLYRAVLGTHPLPAAATALNTDQNDDAPSMAMNLYARRHLDRIDARHGQPAPAGFEVRASASAFVGGPSSGRVSNSQAHRLDDAARSAIGE